MSQQHVDSKIECVLRGSRIQLPIVQSLASLNSRNASRITWHSHDDFELLFLLDGATEYEFLDGQTVVLPGGHFLIIPPRMRHRGQHNIRRPSRLCSILLSRFHGKEVLHSIFTSKEFARILGRIEHSAGLAWPMGTELRKLAMQLASQVRSFDANASVDAAAALRLTVCGTLLEMASQLIEPRTIPPDEAVRSAIAFMEAQFDQSLSIDDVANAVGCSRARLFNIFKAATGLTPNDFLQRLRATQAATMLIETDLSITEIALECGFNTSQYFSSVFRKYQNRTPSQVRQARSITNVEASSDSPTRGRSFDSRRNR